MRSLGHLLLWIGVLGGSFVAVRDPEDVSWPAYAALAVVAIAGVLLLRRTAAASLGTAAQVGQRIDGLRRSLAEADDALRGLAEAGDELDVYAVRDRLDTELAEPLGAFADGREAMIPAFGLDAYGEVMTRFAAAERLVNRSWSASADGYVDEVRSCLGQASGLLSDARERFEAAVAKRDAAPAPSPGEARRV
ncbi:MAG: hypothetical protein H6712_04780 [Myxococcales bacterium]|nr:hypothetical protein [Myxococcales bacterium]MCB9713145.1 hypothetical protein [Myxococcales bacterium]